MTGTGPDSGRGGPQPQRAAGDELDVPLEDPVQMEEVELLSALMIQAGTSDAPLHQSEVDRLLGIDEASA